MTALAFTGLTLLVSYLIGAVPVGYLIARWRGVDILHQGSGNIGATNVGRVLGKRFGILVFLLDFAKGAVPAGTALWLATVPQPSLDSVLGHKGLGVCAGLAAFLGHLFPVYLRFHGGKGVATGFGVVAVLLPGPTLAALITWLVVILTSRYVSLASLSAAFMLCTSRLLSPAPLSAEHATLTVFCLVAAGLVCIRHRANIRRLGDGNENRIQETPIMQTFSKTIHILALGLWFGSAVFFSLIAAPIIFRTFQTADAESAGPTSWVHLLKHYDKETGTRLAGEAVGPLFPWYFLLQGMCGLLAAATALNWSLKEPASRVHKIRTIVLIVAVLTALAGWPLAQYVGELRGQRYSLDSAVAEKARADFGQWHLVSLLLNFVTLALVTLALALAAQLPESQSRIQEREEKQ